ncbi:AzlD domain-containing protein [Solirubrobacter soli]|uniref:AzlD domain-containing protein n=1 Tax=Solirubrobacter soli TaxID=363832 RepID=UPI000408355B|nr:AzlD domain-containing protein [Solirubrobacter soli]
MTAVWITIAVLTVGTAGMKIAGPLLLGERPPGERTLAMTGLVAPALLAALVVYETFSASGNGITLDARAAGLGAAVVAIALRAPMIVVILFAAAVTAGLRAFS